MSTYKSIEDAINEVEYWLRLASFLHMPLKQALLSVLHNDNHNPTYIGLPRDPATLYTAFQTIHKQTIDKLVKKKILQTEQVDLLRPPNSGTVSVHSDNFDVTLIVILIRNCTTLNAPLNGWNTKSPLQHDTSISANVIRAREWRNFVHHCQPAKISRQMFEDKWREGTAIVKALGYIYNTQRLKTISLDPNQAFVLNVLQAYTDTLENEKRTNVNKITALDHNLAWMQKELQRLQKQLDDGSQNILPEVRDILTANIEEDWALLARELGVSETDVLATLNNITLKTNAERMFACLGQLERDLQWITLKSVLRKIARSDILNKIKGQTLLTYGIKDASSKLKEKYIKNLANFTIKHPIITDHETVQRNMTREEAYVDLAILQAEEIDQLWQNSERDFHIAQNHFTHSSIKMEDILMDTDDFVIVRGIAGIGKSTMIESYVLKWANSQILTGEDGAGPKIDFLFQLNCRDINATTNVDSLHDLFKSVFHEVFKEVDIKDLEDISDRVLVILDGVDELKSVDMLDKLSEPSPEKSLKFRCNTHHGSRNNIHLKLIIELMSTRSYFLNGHRTIITARPEICQTITNTFSDSPSFTGHPFKRIEICGFNKENVERYIKKYFLDDNQRIYDILTKIQESKNLSLMASIPIYLWVICNIYQESVLDKPVETTTELCIYACLVFIRNHLKALGNLRTTTLQEMFSNIDIQQILIALASLSFSTLSERTVVFTEKDIKAFQMPIKIEETGFIVRHCYGDSKGYMYQFKHLVLQEFLAGLHLFLENRSSKSYTKRTALRNCIPIVAGLTGIKHHQGGRNIFNILLQNLRKLMKQSPNSRWLKSLPIIRTSSSKMPEYLEIELQKKLSRRELVLDVECSNLMSSLYEYQGKFTSKTVDTVSKIRVEVRNLLFQHDIRNALFLLNELDLKVIDHVSIFNPSNSHLPSNLIEVLNLALSGAEEKRLIICGGMVMSVVTKTSPKLVDTSKHTMPKQQRKEIIVTLTIDVDMATYQEFLMTLMKLVDNVMLRYTAGHHYKQLKKILDSLNVKLLYDDEPFSKIHRPTVQQLEMFSDATRTKGRLQIPKPLQIIDGFLTDNHVKALLPSILYFKVVDLTSNFTTSFTLHMILNHILESHLFRSSFSLNHVKFNMKDICKSEIQHDIFIQRKNAKVSALVDKESLLSAPARYPFYVKAIGKTGYARCNSQVLLHRSWIYSKRNISIIVAEPFLEYDCLTRHVSLIHECFGVRYMDLLDLSQMCFDTATTTTAFMKLATYIPYFKTVTLNGNQWMKPAHIANISTSINNKDARCRIKLLDLSYCNLTDEHLIMLHSCLHLIEAVELRGNVNLSFDILLKVVESITTRFYRSRVRLRYINLSDCGLANDHVTILLSSLPSTVNLFVEPN